MQNKRNKSWQNLYCHSKQYWSSITCQLIVTKTNEPTQFQNLPSCNEFAALLQTHYVLSTHAVSTINGYMYPRGEQRRKLAVKTQNGYLSPTDIILDSELEVKFLIRWKTLEMWHKLHSIHRNYFSFMESEFHSKCCSHKDTLFVLLTEHQDGQLVLYVGHMQQRFKTSWSCFVWIPTG